MQVEYVNHMGDDNMVVDAARVSFNKQVTTIQIGKMLASLNSYVHTTIGHLSAIVSYSLGLLLPYTSLDSCLSTKLASLLMKYPEDMLIMSLLLTAQKCGRSRPGTNKKQGSGNNLEDHYQLYINSLIRDHIEASKTLYNKLIDMNVAPEQARVILPLCTETQWIWTATLEGWLRVCSLRLAEDAQSETREVAKEIAVHIQKLYPICWEASQKEA